MPIGPRPTHSSYQANVSALLVKMQDVLNEVRLMKDRMKRMEQFASKMQDVLNQRGNEIRNVYGAVIALAKIVQSLDPDNPVITDLTNILVTTGSFASLGSAAGPWGTLIMGAAGFIYSVLEAVIG